jgi:hypothetical protein
MKVIETRSGDVAGSAHEESVLRRNLSQLSSHLLITDFEPTGVIVKSESLSENIADIHEKIIKAWKLSRVEYWMFRWLLVWSKLIFKLPKHNNFCSFCY